MDLHYERVLKIDTVLPTRAFFKILPLPLGVSQNYKILEQVYISNRNNPPNLQKRKPAKRRTSNFDKLVDS